MGGPGNGITISQLEELETRVQDALAKRDLAALNVVGFGEISIALGYPHEVPTHVCKRTPPLTEAQFLHYKNVVEGYVADLEAVGVRVVPTEVFGVRRADVVFGYLVQPLLAAETLGPKILLGSDPDPEHGFLGALTETVALASDRLSIDCQVTNWSWDQERLTLLDVGTPFRWNALGELDFDMRPFAAMIPAPFRSLVIKDMTKVIGRWKEPRAVAVDVVSNLHREGLEHWVDPVIAAFNRGLELSDPIQAAEARAMFEADARTFPRLKRLQQMERAWQNSIRRRPYGFFVQESTYRS